MDAHPPALLQALSDARALVERARRVAILTGAGVSAESGVPTFRGGSAALDPDDAQAPLWSRFRPEDLASPRAFARDPALVWRWYAWRRDLVARCAPNAAHLAIARSLAESAAVDPSRATLITQNVDGLHGQAAHALGLDATAPAPIELHGNIWKLRCTRCDVDPWEDRGPVCAAHPEVLPACPACDALARPHIVWFGEALDPLVLRAAFAAADACDVCLVVGTSAVVYPAAELPWAAHRRGARLIEVNPEPTDLTPACAVSLRLPAARALPALLAAPPA